MELMERRQALLDRMLDGGAPNTVGNGSIPRRDPNRPAPLSFSQERFWFLDRLASGSPFHVESSAVLLTQPLDPEKLERAINAVVARHEILRARFQVADGQASQVATPELQIPLPVEDLSGWPREEQELEVARIARDHAMQPFDLGAGPLLRARLLNLGSDRQVFLLAIHHIISDGWSMGIFSREVSAHYRTFAEGRLNGLPELPIQYFDYAAWQRESLRGDALADQLDYWRGQLKDLPELRLPLDHPRPRVLAYRGSQLDVAVPSNLSAGLRVIARREKATLFMASLAVFGLLLEAYSDQDDFAVGTPVAGRGRVELESLIGVFLNTLVLRLDLTGDPSYRELLRRIKRAAVNAYDNQDVPFERLVEEFQPERDLGKNPLFQALFQFFTPPSTKTGGAALQPDTVPVDRGAAILDLAYHLWDTPAGIRGRIEYSTELFERATIERQFQRFLEFLRQVLARSDRRLSELEVVLPEERELLLARWQGPSRPAAGDAGLCQIFERRAREAPNRLAILEETQSTSFGCLEQQANRIAHRLLELGAQRGDRVAVLLERSAALAAALLGTLKAGAAFVPLDPSFPARRLACIVEDAKPRFLITNQRHREAVLCESVEVLCLDAQADEILRADAEPPATRNHPLDLAYVIYTSGSTGRPKGVMGLHGATLNRFAWMWAEFPFGPNEVACQRTAMSFVDSIWELFGPLLAGAPLAVVPDETGRDPRALAALLGRRRVTRLLTVPSLLQAVLDSGVDLPNEAPELRLVFSSGERLPAELALRFRDAAPEVKLVNLYGASEVAGDIAWEPVQPEAAGDSVPIGRPIAHSCAYVLDAKLRLVPPGATGQLYVAGPNLARGYFGQPGLTAERFAPNPFSSEPGARMYATGDMVRHLPDGRLDYIGRRDEQVKVRGFRVELQEVEAVLREHPKIREAAVGVESAGAEARLVAYLVAVDEPPGIDELRGFVGARLPAHMAPSAFLTLDALPLTPSGKINRRALAGATEVKAIAVEFVAPRTDAEEAVAAIWRDLLHVEDVGAHDNFFDRGGHSLLAIRLVSRIRDGLGLELPLREVFLNPTLAELAQRIESKLLDEIEQLSEAEARQRLDQT